MTEPRRELLSLTEAARYANLSVGTLRRYIADGRLPGYRVGPKLMKVDLADLDALTSPMSRRGPGLH